MIEAQGSQTISGASPRQACLPYHDIVFARARRGVNLSRPRRARGAHRRRASIAWSDGRRIQAVVRQNLLEIQQISRAGPSALAGPEEKVQVLRR
jgi:hypothetical protein